jgi:ATP-binding cassette subfamily F protein 3
MDIIIGARDIKKAYGTRTLLENVNFEVREGERAGLVGVNGSGKTTLLKLVTGQLEPDGGSVTRAKLAVIGYMDQYACTTPERTVWDETLSVFAPLMELEARIDEVNRAIDAGETQLVSLQHRLREDYENKRGLTYKSLVRAMLLGLGFGEETFLLETGALSGGQKAKVQLGKLLLDEPDILLLDEPTNHLDVAACEWLEEFLLSYRGAYVVVSHDRYFLDRVTTRTLEIENGRLTAYDGNYSAYVRQKADNREQALRRYSNVRKEMKRIEGIIEQQRRWNREKNIKTAESKEKQLARLAETLEEPEVELESMRLRLRAAEGGANEVVVARGLSKAYPEKVLFEALDLTLMKGERVVLLGANSTGKTPLLKIILGLLEPDAGSARLGANIRPGYFAQEHDDLNIENSVLDEVYNARPDMTLTELRSLLGAFLFKGDDVFKPISRLSGGERARVELFKLMLSGANLLLLDEPTNHLDISSREALEDALLGFGGTMLIISHDRYFINKLATRIAVLTPGGLDSYVGGYDAYAARIKAPLAVKRETKPAADNDYLKQKEARRTQRMLESRLARAEAAVEALEAQAAELEAALTREDVASDYKKTLELTAALDALNIEKDAAYAEWDAAQKALEDAAAEGSETL